MIEVVWQFFSPSMLSKTTKRALRQLWTKGTANSGHVAWQLAPNSMPRVAGSNNSNSSVTDVVKQSEGASYSTTPPSPGNLVFLKESTVLILPGQATHRLKFALTGMTANGGNLEKAYFNN